MGGADAKAVMVLALTFPFYPELTPPAPPLPILNKGFGIFTLTVLTNSLIATPFIMIVFVLRNLKEGFSAFKEHPVGFLMGYRVEVSNFPRFHYLLQVVRGGEVVNLRRGIDPDPAQLEALRKAGCQRVWVTPQIPFLVFITAGFVLAIFFGDLLVFLSSLLWDLL